MNYATGAAFNLDEMFLNFPFKKLDLSCKDALKINGNEHKKFLVKKIFRTGLRIILEDIINNNNTFKLPTGAIQSEIHMKRIYGDEFKKARQNGKFKEIDFLSSMFSGYELVLDMYKKGGLKRSKTIYVDKKLKQKIIDNTNKGIQYC